jgi:hypothetical protein
MTFITAKVEKRKELGIGNLGLGGAGKAFAPNS